MTKITGIVTVANIHWALSKQFPWRAPLSPRRALRGHSIHSFPEKKTEAPFMELAQAHTISEWQSRDLIPS